MELILIIGKTYWTFIKGPIYTKAYQKLKSYFYCCIYKKKLKEKIETLVSKNWDGKLGVSDFFFFFPVAFNLQ